MLAFCSLFILKFCVTIFYYHETLCPWNPNSLVNTINQDPETTEQVPEVKISDHLVQTTVIIIIFLEKYAFEIMLTEHTHDFNPTQYFNSIRCVGGYFKLT